MQFYLLCRSSHSLHSPFRFLLRRPAVAFSDWLDELFTVVEVELNRAEGAALRKINGKWVPLQPFASGDCGPANGKR
jgi:hypothetical protein